ncbi:sigma 54-interacting transcriptional regulator [Fusibacter sp. JL298sf-3]
MKPTISIITQYAWSSTFLVKQLEHIFGELFTITCHASDTVPIHPLYNADLILLHEPSALIEMQPYIRCKAPLLLMRRTISADACEKLKTIPPGTKTAVVNINSYMAHETMTNIYQLGINTLELLPWAPDMKTSFPDVSWVITHRKYDFLPSLDVPMTIIGSRIITADVIMDILSYFNMDMKTIDCVFSNYLPMVPNFLKGVQTLLENNKFLSLQWRLLYDKLEHAVAVLSEDQRITSYNTHFSKLIPPPSRQPLHLEDLCEAVPEISILKAPGEIHEQVVQLNNHTYIVNTRFLDPDTPRLGKVVFMEKYNHIAAAHHRVHKQLTGDGLIGKYDFQDIIGTSKSLLTAKKLATKFAKSQLPVLLYGESGTGKELFASAIHNTSTRQNGPFVAVNCAGVPDTLIESEFFGYEGAAFTGAKKTGAMGLFEKAHNGTLFLDEISELPYPLQGKLLRAIQEKEIRRVGSTQMISVDVRVIAASNRNLKDMTENGTFRTDLFFRLNVLSLTLPPLRKRKNDIQLLCQHFMAPHNLEATSDFYKFASAYTWPGNVRELQNIIEYLSVIDDTALSVESLPDYIERPAFMRPLDDTEIKMAILRTLSTRQKSGHSTGRRSLTEHLNKTTCTISEAEVRKHLKNLSEMGYILLQQGRRGTVLTSKGDAYLTTYCSK